MTTQSIPASQIVSVTPAVLGTGGNPLALNGVCLTESLLTATGTVEPWTSAAAVGAKYGLTSDEYLFAVDYFTLVTNAPQLPGTLFLAPYAAAARAAWLLGASLTLTLAQLQSLSGTLSVTIDGVLKTGNINLSAATSFSNAAALIATGLSLSAGQTCTFVAGLNAFQITSGTTGTASTITEATNDAFAASLGLTLATGATLSQGVAPDTPTSAMNNVVRNTQNWALFTTLWEPDTATCLLFAAWANGTNSRYGYVGWDTDVVAEQPNQSGTFGAQATLAAYNAVFPLWVSSTVTLHPYTKAAAILAYAASIDWARTNGRTVAAFRNQPGLLADVVDGQIAQNLLGNGYNFYGTYGTANDSFTWFYDGHVTGEWAWLDTFLAEVYLNAQLQLAFMSLFQNTNRIPYNEQGYSLIRAAALDPINQAIDNGTITPGVTLSAQQVAEINMQAGKTITDTLQSAGWYLQIKDATAQTRGLRGSPPMTLWYTDGGSVQKIALQSVDVM